MQTTAGLVFGLAFSVGAMALQGCASASVSNKTVSKPAAGAPQKVYVGKFELGAAAIQSDPGTLTGRPRLFHFGQSDQSAELEKLGNLLGDEVVKDLNHSNLPAQRLAAGEARPDAGWIVSGEFLELSQGNRLQRAILGFGAGTSDAKLYVRVADLASPDTKDLMTFDADATGNKTPGGAAGAAITHTPWGMVGKFVLERNASEKDIERVAKEIADEIVVFSQKS